MENKTKVESDYFEITRKDEDEDNEKWSEISDKFSEAESFVRIPKAIPVKDWKKQKKLKKISNRSRARNRE